MEPLRDEQEFGMPLSATDSAQALVETAVEQYGELEREASSSMAVSSWSTMFSTQNATGVELS